MQEKFASFDQFGLLFAHLCRQGASPEHVLSDMLNEQIINDFTQYTGSAVNYFEVTLDLVLPTGQVVADTVFRFKLEDESCILLKTFVQQNYV